jgi:asparagine N-glycosylation enzyme membrane subunit Stt3
VVPVSTRILLPGTLGLLAFGLRVLPWPTVLAPQGVFFPEPDAYYHLRRIAYSVAKFPAVLETDSYINFPTGAKPIWTPLFDWLLALGLWTIPTTRSDEALEWILAWVPPLLGALCVLALTALSRRDFGERVALLAGALLAVLPAHFWYSQLGFLDHHVAVALASVIVLWALLATLRSEALRPALALGAALGAALLLWPGCLLEVALVATALSMRVLRTADPTLARTRARRFAAVFAIAALLVAPLGLASEWPRWGELSPLVLSRFQPLLLAAAALWLAALAELWRWNGVPASAVGRLVAVGGVGAALALLLVALAPELPAGLADAWAWLARREEFQAVVAESAPLLASQRSARVAGRLLTPLVWITPALLAALVWLARRRGPWPAGAVVAGWCLAFFVAALAQRRFVASLAAPFALTVAACAVPAARELRRRLAGRRAAGVFALGAIAAASFALARPVADFYAHPLANLVRAARGEPPAIRGWQRTQRALVPLARWLALHSPPTSGWLDPAARPEYGVLAAWGDGHLLRWIARRPLVQDNFGDDVGARNFALAERYYAATSEQEALAILSDLQVRYVVVRGTGSGHGEGYAPESLFARLHWLKGSSGSLGAGPPGAVIRVAALARHRLLFDAAARDARAGESRPAYKLYEIVPGARVAGNAAPGALVTLRLPVHAGSAGGFVYATETTADASGRYALTLPYANEGAVTDLHPAARYELRCGETSATLSIDESAVREGRRIEGPELSEAVGGGDVVY